MNNNNTSFKSGSKRAFAAYLLMYCLSFVGMVAGSSAHAAFELNFSPHSSTSGTSASTLAIHTGAGGVDATNQTEFYINGSYHVPELVWIDGIQYHHVIVGSLGEGFMQESYVQVDGAINYGYNTSYTGTDGSFSAGNGAVVMNGGLNTRVIDAANGHRPLSADAGNGTADPRRVVMRQLVNSGEMVSEFLKDGLNYKPKISMMIVAPDIDILFDVDMRHIPYVNTVENNNAATNSTASMFLQMQIYDADVPQGSDFFDISDGSQFSFSDAGRFEYNPGDVGAVGDGADGTYSHVGGSFDLDAVNWRLYMHDASITTNPWAFEEGKLAP